MRDYVAIAVTKVEAPENKFSTLAAGTDRDVVKEDALRLIAREPEYAVYRNWGDLFIVSEDEWQTLPFRPTNADGTQSSFMDAVVLATTRAAYRQAQARVVDEGARRSRWKFWKR